MIAETEDGHAGLPPEPVGEGQGVSLRSTFASLTYRDFVYLWLGQLTQAFALWLEQTARPLLILALTGSAVQLGGVILARTVPAVVMGLAAGVVADNFNRRLVLLTTRCVVTCLSVVFAVLVVTGLVEIWHIYAFSFLRGATMAFDQPARRAMIPTIVPARLVLNAMALSTGSMGVMRIAGAASAGLLMGFFGFSAPFVVIAVVYGGGIFFLWMLRTPDHERSGYQGTRRMGSDFREGFRFAWNSSTVRGVVIIGVGYFAFGMAFMQVFAPLFATQILNIGESGFGFLIAALGTGSILGSLILAAVNPTRKRGVLMLGMLATFGLLLILFSAGTYLHSIPLAFFLMAILGIGQSSFMPLINAVLVVEAPENMRGRIMAILSLDRAMTAFGGFLAGILAAAIGPQIAQIIFGIGCIATAAIMFTTYPALRRVQ